ncbi:MAG: carboxypeptidase-like regulatory domain-containing protein, partial [Cyclobacteriaceae bacterium]
MKKLIYKPLIRTLSFLCMGILGPLFITGSGTAFGINSHLKIMNEMVIDVSSEDINITGKVTSETEGVGIPGVNILVKGTTMGTVTDAEGNYRLNAPDGSEVLIFSSIGYITQEVAINGRNLIDITLVEDLQGLEEVVVVGYGLQDKVNLTGS